VLLGLLVKVRDDVMRLAAAELVEAAVAAAGGMAEESGAGRHDGGRRHKAA
jgi:hypothetical protein